MLIERIIVFYFRGRLCRVEKEYILVLKIISRVVKWWLKIIFMLREINIKLF